MPHQNIKISEKIAGNKIYEFEVTTEDGTIYIFGRESSAIEASKYSTFNIPIQFKDQYSYVNSFWIEPYVGMELQIFSQSVNPRLKYDISKEIKLTEDFFNTSWYLKKSRRLMETI